METLTLESNPVTKNYLDIRNNLPPVVEDYNSKSEVKELVLREWQVASGNKSKNILEKNHGMINVSPMGSGKTIATLWLAKQYGYSILVGCPKIITSMWENNAKQYGVNIVGIISYQSLRSTKGHNPKHGLLTRIDNKTEKGQTQTNFYPTDAYMRLLEKGILVVFDEFQNIKNNTSQYKACANLIKPILLGGKSRYILLSGTPFDKEEHAINLLKLMGYIRSPRLYNYIKETRQLILEGAQELIDICNFINPSETRKILNEVAITKGKINNLCYRLYIQVVKDYISTEMPLPPTIESVFDVKNGFYNIDNKYRESLWNSISELASAVRFNERTGTTNIQNDNIGAITTALVHIERDKVYDMARVATKILNFNINNKLIIGVNYNATIDALYNSLILFNPLILRGNVNNTNRNKIINMFNNDSRYRLIIMNTAVGGIGISLHDTTGKYPRFMLLSPTYKMLDIAQAASRIYRDGTLSDAVVRIFYGKDDGDTKLSETGILNAIARKTSVVKSTLSDINKLTLPGDYKSYIE